jgi:hypothetical protein
LENIFLLICEFLLSALILFTTLTMSILQFSISGLSSSLDEEPSDYPRSFRSFYFFYIFSGAKVVSWVFWFAMKKEEEGFTFLRLFTTISYLVSKFSLFFSSKILLDFSSICYWLLNFFLHFLAYYKLCFFVRCNAVIWSSVKMTSIAF